MREKNAKKALISEYFLVLFYVLSLLVCKQRILLYAYEMWAINKLAAC